MGTDFTSLGMNDPDVVASPPPSRRLGWIAIGFAIVGIAFLVASVVSGGRLRWWQIAIPMLTIGNVAATSFGVFKNSPRLRQAYFVASSGIALAVTASILLGLAK